LPKELLAKLTGIRQSQALAWVAQAGKPAPLKIYQHLNNFRFLQAPVQLRQIIIAGESSGLQ
jgi:hypothetical protein